MPYGEFAHSDSETRSQSGRRGRHDADDLSSPDERLAALIRGLGQATVDRSTAGPDLDRLLARCRDLLEAGTVTLRVFPSAVGWRDRHVEIPDESGLLLQLFETGVRAVTLLPTPTRDELALFTSALANPAWGTENLALRLATLGLPHLRLRLAGDPHLRVSSRGPDEVWLDQVGEPARGPTDASDRPPAPRCDAELDQHRSALAERLAQVRRSLDPVAFFGGLPAGSLGASPLPGLAEILAAWPGRLDFLQFRVLAAQGPSAPALRRQLTQGSAATRSFRADPSSSTPADRPRGTRAFRELHRLGRQVVAALHDVLVETADPSALHRALRRWQHEIGVPMRLDLVAGDVWTNGQLLVLDEGSMRPARALVDRLAQSGVGSLAFSADCSASDLEGLRAMLAVPGPAPAGQQRGFAVERPCIDAEGAGDVDLGVITNVLDAELFRLRDERFRGHHPDLAPLARILAVAGQALDRDPRSRAFGESHADDVVAVLAFATWLHLHPADRLALGLAAAMLRLLHDVARRDLPDALLQYTGAGEIALPAVAAALAAAGLRADPDASARPGEPPGALLAMLLDLRDRICPQDGRPGLGPVDALLVVGGRWGQHAPLVRLLTTWALAAPVAAEAPDVQILDEEDEPDFLDGSFTDDDPGGIFDETTLRRWRGQDALVDMDDPLRWVPRRFRKRF